MNLKEIFTKSFKFLIFDWRFFAIVLAFYLFRHFWPDILPPLWSWMFYMFGFSKGRFFIMSSFDTLLDSLFWIVFIPFVIYAAIEFFTKQQKIVFNINLAKKHLTPLLTYQFIFLCLNILTSYLILYSFTSLYGTHGVMAATLLLVTIEFLLEFLLIFTPIIIVLENEKFFMAVKKSISIIRNNLKGCLIFYLILMVVISLLLHPVIQIRMWYAFINGQGLSLPSELFYLQLVLNSIWFLIYPVAVVGFYLSIKNREKIK